MARSLSEVMLEEMGYTKVGELRMHPELARLFVTTDPVPGKPGCRIDSQGKQWYSDAWIHYHDS